jgi:hypothetical protein
MKSIALLALLSTVALSTISAPVHAQDGSDWLSKERFQIRGRMIAILADGDGIVNTTTLETDVDNAYVP